MHSFELLLLEGATPGSAGTINFLFIGLMILIFWFFLIRPQTKKQKEQNTFVDAMQKGDDIVTTSGILGRINKIEDQIVTLEVGTKTYIRVTKNAISKELTEAVYKSDDQATK